MDRRDLTRRSTMNAMAWGSDSDLVGDLGIRLGPEFSNPRESLPRPAPVALPPESYQATASPVIVDNRGWSFPKRVSAETDETDMKSPQLERTPSPGEMRHLARRVSFFDIGGLLDDGGSPRSNNSRTNTSAPPLSPLPGLPAPRDFAPSRGRQGSLALLQDIGGVLSSEPPPQSPPPAPASPPPRNFSRPGHPQPTSPGPARPMPVRTNTLQDVGGLLS